MNTQQTVHTLYKKLLNLYPADFKDLLGESMEQTFRDLWNEKRQAKKGLIGFMLWSFTETILGIFREHLLLFYRGEPMQTTLKTTGSSALIGFLLILPFMIMEVVNRRNFNEDFPIMLFFVLWFDLFAVGLILLPIVRGRRTGNDDMSNPVPAQGKTLLTNPRPALMLSGVLILIVVIPSLLASLGREPLEGLNTAYVYAFGVQVPSRFIAFALYSLPIAAGIIAGVPIVNTLRAGGSLFAHPVHLLIVVVISLLFAAGAAGLIADQWPCFIGVPNCD
jgi:hypothetical protein